MNKYASNIALATEQIISRQEEELKFTCSHSSPFLPFHKMHFFKHG